MPESRSRPLRVRPGARFACSGDGLCCTDIHALGPLGKRDQAVLRLISPALLVRRSGARDMVLATDEDGRCMLASTTGCELHAQLGAKGKPAACNRFPIGLTATPTGGRITTAHRCSCRSMGERPPLAVEDAVEALHDRSGRVRADSRVPGPMRSRGRRVLSFDRYEQRERKLIEALTSGVDPRRALDVKPFPESHQLNWLDAAASLRRHQGSSRYEVMLDWFSMAIEAVVAAHRPRWPSRPWADCFESATRRSPVARSPHLVFGDWAADEFWRLGWANQISLAQKTLEVRCLLELGYRMASVTRRRGVRPDAAAAEAVSILELARLSEEWQALVHSLPG